MPAGVLVSRFRRHYTGSDVYASRRYATRDGVIPFGLFWIYYRAMESNQAFERIQHAKAVASAIGLAFAGKGAGIPESLRAELRAAFLD